MPPTQTTTHNPLLTIHSSGVSFCRVRSRVCFRCSVNGAGDRDQKGGLLPLHPMFDPMSDLSAPAGSDDPLAPTSNFSSGSSGSGQPPRRQGGGGGGAGRYGEELHSITIRARQRTFYIDLKQSQNGKFLKVSEKSRGGQKSTIIFDIEDLPKFIEALGEMQKKI